MGEATRRAIEFADKVIEAQRPLWLEALADLGIDPNAPGTPAELANMPIEVFLSGTPRRTLEA